MHILITGGAGFIGGNLTYELLKDPLNHIYIFDNLSTGNLMNIPKDNIRVEFFNVDLKQSIETWPKIKNLSQIYHLSANADVRGGIKNRDTDFYENALTTKNICEYGRLNNINHLAFASSAAVYGEPKIFPTPESYNCVQTSLYGASKIAGESYIQAYSEYGDFTASIFRFVSWIGKGYSHGVIYDFIKKLKKNETQLEILGDGSQKKSFLDVQDGIEGVINLTNSCINKCEIFNLGHSEIISVNELANIVCDEMKLKNVKYIFTGGKRGWIGDSPIVHLDTSKAQKKGWNAKISIEKGIRNTVNYLLSDERRLFR